MIAYPSIDPVAIEFGPLQIRWYGLAYAAGILLAWYLGQIRARKGNAPISAPQVTDLILYVAFGAIVGGRVGYTLFYDFSHFVFNPLDVFKLWQGGMSFHGGLLGAIAGIWIYSRSKRIEFLNLSDFLSPLCTIGLFFGRLANFINQELWGRESSLPIAMVFPNDPLQLTRHPSQLYEAALEGILLFLILWIYSVKPRAVGAVSGLFLLCYGVFRFLVEFFREPDVGIGFVFANWVTMGQILSLPLIVAGLWLLYFSYKKSFRFK